MDKLDKDSQINTFKVKFARNRKNIFKLEYNKTVFDKKYPTYSYF